MSPLSVSDTLPLDASLFDLVVFDEASQIPLEEAVPALHRAGQAVVVGDQMQLPPTGFFSSTAGASDLDEIVVEEDGEQVSVTLDGDSFLNQSSASLPSVLLAWHYRSRSEGLIGFSNAAFYGGELRTVPDRAVPRRSRPQILVEDLRAAEAGVDALLDRPMSFHLLPHGIYDQRRNAGEATYVAELVRGFLARGSGLSVGIVAFSEAQQSSIEEALRRLATEDAAFATALERETEREEDDQFVGLFVKNLENVQGDERDVVILSVCYGPDPTGRTRMNFGPINAKGGEKRLNVIFSRAKHHMAVVSSMRSHAITNDWNEGAAALKGFLRYAEACSAGDQDLAGAVLDAFLPQARRSQRAPSSLVVGEAASALRAAGLEVATHLGSSAIRCDLAVRRPGDEHHRLAVLVDHNQGDGPATDDHGRFVDRPRAFAATGWETTHLLAKDWLVDPAGVVDRIRRRLDGPDGEPDVGAGDASARGRRRGIPATVVVAPPPAGEADLAAPQHRLPAPRATAAVPVAAPRPRPPRPAKATEAPARRRRAAAPAPAEPSSAEPPSSTASDPVVPVIPPPSAGQRFEFVEGTSSKFWLVRQAGTTVFVTFGRIGSAGQTQIKQFDSADAAGTHVVRLIAEKTRKGYKPPPSD